MSKIVSIIVVFIVTCIYFVQSQLPRSLEGLGQEAYEYKKGDLPYVACEVCTVSVKEIFDVVATKRRFAPSNRVDEIYIVDQLERLCKYYNSTTHWTRRFDIVEEKGYMFLHS